MTTQKTILDPSFYDYTLLSKNQLLTIFEFYVTSSNQILQDNSKKSRTQKRVKKSSVNNQQSDMRCFFIYLKNSKDAQPDIYDVTIDLVH